MREGNRLSSVITAALGGRNRHRALDEPTLQCLLFVTLMAEILRGISCHQRPSEAIRGHQRPYAPISAHQRRTNSSMSSKLPSSWVHGWSALSCPVTYAQNSA